MRLLGVTIPDNKKLEFGLTVLYGIGLSRAGYILSEAKVDMSKKGKEVTLEEEQRIRKVIEAIKLEGDLRREIAGNIKRLKDIKSYRGMRHSRRLSVRGQRTRTNSRTIRGNVRKTMGSGKRKAEKK